MRLTKEEQAVIDIIQTATRPRPLVTMGTIIRFPNRVRAELRGRLGEVLGPAGPGTVDVLVGDIVVSDGTLKAACWRDNYQREQS